MSNIKLKIVSENILYIDNISFVDNVANKIIEMTHPNRKFAFYGKMGVGKTTLIKAICSKIGVIDMVNSPTFSIVNEYKTSFNYSVYHFDCYRINKIDEMYSLGYEEYFFGTDYCFIEWSENIESLIYDDMVQIHMNLEQDKRKISIIT